MTVFQIDCRPKFNPKNSKNTKVEAKVLVHNNLLEKIWAYLSIQNVFRGLVGLNIVLAVVYLITLNGFATEAYGLESLKGQKLELQKQLEATDIALAIPASLYALESDEMIQSLPLVTQKNYIAIPTGEMAFLSQ